MEAQAERIELPFTYTYDQFTVFFHGDHVFVGGQDFPMGQCCVDNMNLDEATLTEIAQRALALLPPAQNLLKEKTDRAAASAQEKLNAVWDVIFALPVYRELRMDEACITTPLSGSWRTGRGGPRCWTPPRRDEPPIWRCWRGRLVSRKICGPFANRWRC